MGNPKCLGLTRPFRVARGCSHPAGSPPLVFGRCGFWPSMLYALRAVLIVARQIADVWSNRRLVRRRRHIGRIVPTGIVVKHTGNFLLVLEGRARRPALFLFRPAWRG